MNQLQIFILLVASISAAPAPDHPISPRPRHPPVHPSGPPPPISQHLGPTPHHPEPIPLPLHAVPHSPAPTYEPPAPAYEPPAYEPRAYHPPEPSYRPPTPSYHPPSYKEPEVPPAYNYGYQVADEYSGVYIEHNQERDGYSTLGQYVVDLPDGRKQYVKYSDEGEGLYADVQYEGEAHYPEPRSKYGPQRYV